MSDIDMGQVPDDSQSGPQDGPEDDGNPADGVEGADNANDAPDVRLDADKAEATIQRLRKENAAARVKAKETEALARKVHTALVSATGRLVDPEVLPYDPEHLTDTEKLCVAIDKLTEAKPYLKALKASGDAGQGNRGSADSGEVSLLGLMRG